MGLFGGPKRILKVKDLSNIWSKDKQLVKDMRQFVAKLDVQMEEQLVALLLESIERSNVDLSAMNTHARKLAAEDFFARNAVKLNGLYVKLG
jgi:hypothetical protein